MSGEVFEAHIQNLVKVLSNNEKVRALGVSGGEKPYPEPGEGDIDLFIYCSEVPSKAERQEMLSACSGFVDRIKIGCLNDSNWGQGDLCYVDGVETWLMYFTVAEAKNELEEILTGDYLWKVDNYYYPLGRCAMWKSMRAFYDVDGMLSEFKTRLGEYPISLVRKVVQYHIGGLGEHEDLLRAVKRKDVFFYHFAFELALDQFLQVIFALNRTYFPSRKRSEQYINGFQIKPADCVRRLKRVVALGGDPETVEESYSLWCELERELVQMADQTVGGY